MLLSWYGTRRHNRFIRIVCRVSAETKHIFRLTPFFKVDRKFTLRYDAEKAHSILMEIVNSKYDDIKYSIYGSFNNKKGIFEFYAKHGNWRPFLGTGPGAKMEVVIKEINGKVTITAEVSRSLFFAFILLLSTIIFIISIFLKGFLVYKILAYLIVLFITIRLDKLNKSILLSLLERYIR